MVFNRLRLVAQVIGFLVIGMFAFAGAQSLLSGHSPVLAAIGLAAPVPQAPQAVTAVVPTLMNFQGTLRGPDGQLLANGAYTLTFRIYTNLGHPIGSAVWSEQHTGVTVFDGRFSALLGDGQPAVPIPATLFSNPNLYIGVTVEGLGIEMLPRQRFASVPFAFYAERANGLSAADGSPADAVVVDNDGVVGINIDGTPTQAAKLRVWGAVRGGYNDSNYVDIGHWSNGYINMVGQGRLDFRHEGSTVMSLTDSGNLGIGVTNPSARLHVVGNATVTGNIQASGSISSTGDIAWNRATGHLTGFAVSNVYSADAPGGAPFFQKVTMTPTSNSICYLTEVRLITAASPLNQCMIGVESGNWFLQASAVSGGDIICAAHCLQW